MMSKTESFRKYEHSAGIKQDCCNKSKKSGGKSALESPESLKLMFSESHWSAAGITSPGFMYAERT